MNKIKPTAKPAYRFDLSDDFFAAMKILAPELLPEIEREKRFHKTRKWRFDFALPHFMIAIECDGGQIKAGGGRHNQDSDREKLNTAAAMGWLVLRFSGRQILNDPMRCLDHVKTAINQRKLRGFNNEAINS